jgi:hypothetical protein
LSYALQFNHTPGIGCQAIVEIYDEVMEVPTAFPADLVVGECSRNATIEQLWDEYQPLDKSPWKLIFGYNDDDMLPCLRLLLERVSGLAAERVDELMIEVGVELALDRIGDDEFDLDDFYDGSDADSDAEDGDTL